MSDPIISTRTSQFQLTGKRRTHIPDYLQQLVSLVKPRLPGRIPACHLHGQRQPEGKDRQRGDVEAETETDPVLDELLIGNELHVRVLVRFRARLSEA